MEDCIFCKLANGVFPTNAIYEDDDFKAILDNGPATKGHALVLPKKHYANLFEIPEDTLAGAAVVAKKVAGVMKDKLHCDGLNLVQNNGEAAGQTVFHFHVHVIPRYTKDTVNVTWKQGSYGEGEAAKIAEELKARI